MLRVSILLLFLSLLRFPHVPEGVAQTRSTPADAAQLAGLEAFARLYGVLRFFHPSDEAAATEWNHFAVLGARRLLAAGFSGEHADVLRELIAPIAPSVRIHDAGEPPPGGLEWDDAPADRVAWQHFGGGLVPFSYYSSKRTARSGIQGGREAVRVVQLVPLPSADTRWVRFQAAARAELAPGGAASLMVLFPSAPGPVLHGLPIPPGPWTSAEWVAPVVPGSPVAVLGVAIAGSGSLWWDDVEVHASADSVEWHLLPLMNAQFEESGAGAPRGWNAFVMDTTGIQLQTDTLTPFRGRGSGHLKVDEPPRLFEAEPAPGSATVLTLGDGLVATVPLVLPSVAGRTRPQGDPEALQRLRQAAAAAWQQDSTVGSAAVRVAGVVAAWSILQHFFPYHDEVTTDWEAVLRPALEAALHATTPAEYHRVLSRLLVPLQDGHARVAVPGLPPQHHLPVRVVRVGARLVVAASDVEDVQPGDILDRIDGQPALELLQREIALRAGSPQYREHLALGALGAGPPGSTATLRVERVGQAPLTVWLPRSSSAPPRVRRPAPITPFEDGLLYVDLTRVGAQQVQPRLPELLAARGIVLDLRGYPQDGAHSVLSHLATEPMRFFRGYVAEIIHPGRTPPPQWSEVGGLPEAPRYPRICAPTVFLTDAGAMSYGETVMGLVKHYRLGPVVGTRTGGVNGDQNRAMLPGNVHLFWTGTRVVRHDGGRHFAIGYEPTVPVEPTWAGLASSTDEQLEVALTLAREGRATCP